MKRILLIVAVLVCTASAKSVLASPESDWAAFDKRMSAYKEKVRLRQRILDFCPLAVADKPRTQTFYLAIAVCETALKQCEQTRCMDALPPPPPDPFEKYKRK